MFAFALLEQDTGRLVLGRDRLGIKPLYLTQTGDRLRFSVDDDGQGLPEGFDLDGQATLGLSIVGTLVQSELGGRLRLGPAPSGHGTRAEIDVPV